MSDSNEDIKNRLSETVRDNAKHLLDPHRKVNGEPVPAHQPCLFTGGVMRWYQIEGIEWLRVSRSLPIWACESRSLLFVSFIFDVVILPIPDSLSVCYDLSISNH